MQESHWLGKQEILGYSCANEHCDLFILLAEYLITFYLFMLLSPLPAFNNLLLRSQHCCLWLANPYPVSTMGD